MPVHFMRYILHLADKKTIKATDTKTATLRVGMGFKQEAVVYTDQSGELTVRGKDEFERMFQPEKA